MKKNIEDYGSLQKSRLKYKPRYPIILDEELVTFQGEEIKMSDEEEIKNIFPITFKKERIEFKKGELEVKDINVGGIFK
jgi:hypothetical protein